MGISNKRIWQVAAGDAERCYADLCLEWDVILNGPGWAGPWPECAEALRRDYDLSTRKLRDLKWFCEEVADGDLVVLRLGTTDVFGVGEVVGVTRGARSSKTLRVGICGTSGGCAGCGSMTAHLSDLSPIHLSWATPCR